MAVIPELPPLPALPEPIVIEIEDVTTGTLDGIGTFDKLMQISRIHLMEEYTKGRIDSSEYAQVYLGTMSNTLDKSLAFTLNKDKAGLEAAILQLEYQKAILDRHLVIAQIDKIYSEIEVNNQAILLSQAQEDNLQAELLNIPKEGDKLDQEISLISNQILKIIEETDNLHNDNGFRS